MFIGYPRLVCILGSRAPKGAYYFLIYRPDTPKGGWWRTSSGLVWMGEITRLAACVTPTLCCVCARAYLGRHGAGDYENIFVDAGPPPVNHRFIHRRRCSTLCGQTGDFTINNSTSSFLVVIQILYQEGRPPIEYFRFHQSYDNRS